MGLLRPITRCFTILWSVFNKLLCFLHIKRNRKNSGSLLPLHNTSRVLSNDIQLPVPTNDVELQSWEVWEPENRFNEQSKFHNQHLNSNFATNKMNAVKGSEEVSNIDYFQALQLEPEIKKTQKIIIRKKEEQQATPNRLAMADITPTSDLGTLEDSEYGGWSEETIEDITMDAIKGKRRMEREKKLLEHHQKKLDRELQHNKKRDRVSALGKLS